LSKVTVTSAVFSFTAGKKSTLCRKWELYGEENGMYDMNSWCDDSRRRKEGIDTKQNPTEEETTTTTTTTTTTKRNEPWG